MSNPEPHEHLTLASVPSVLTFVNESAAIGYERQNRDTRGETAMTSFKTTPALNPTGIEARCASTGMRMTEQRRVIARVLA
jgi:hypothetical protein